MFCSWSNHKKWPKNNQVKVLDQWLNSTPALISLIALFLLNLLVFCIALLWKVWQVCFFTHFAGWKVPPATYVARKQRTAKKKYSMYLTTMPWNWICDLFFDPCETFPQTTNLRSTGSLRHKQKIGSLGENLSHLVLESLQLYSKTTLSFASFFVNVAMVVTLFLIRTRCFIDRLRFISRLAAALRNVIWSLLQPLIGFCRNWKIA